MKTIRLALAGLGNVGRNFLRLMDSQRDLLRDVYGLELVLVGAADSSGVIVDANGIDNVRLFEHKAQRNAVATFSGAHSHTPLLHTLVEHTNADILLEATPVNLQHGQPGLNLVRAALRRGMVVVLANKGPLALAYQELRNLALTPNSAPTGRGELRFSACVGGALPTVNVGMRDLAGARITKVEAAVNGTCQGIVRMMERGVAFDDALAEMQRRGVVEPDPSLDIDGWDEAVKLVIIANVVLRQPTTIHDISVEGIRNVTTHDLHAARARSERVTLMGLAEWNGARYDLSVKPVSLPMDHPISRMGDDEMGVVYHTDIAGRISAFSEEIDAMPTAAAMLRDVIDVSGVT
jgi:homoserine dehydrogenase